MAKDAVLSKLSEEEKKLNYYWNSIIQNLRTDKGRIDLAYIWTDEVQKYFEGIKTEAEKIAFFLERLHLRYKTNEQKYYKEISDIRNLIRHLNKVEAKAEWVREIKMELEEIIGDVEGEKINLKKILCKVSRYS